MNFTNHPDWCDDCCWEWPTRKGYQQMHRHPCNCVCHHPSRLLSRPAQPTAQPGWTAPEYR